MWHITRHTKPHAHYLHVDLVAASEFSSVADNFPGSSFVFFVPSSGQTCSGVIRKIIVITIFLFAKKMLGRVEL